jgi:hypothetical protein
MSLQAQETLSHFRVVSFQPNLESAPLSQRGEWLLCIRRTDAGHRAMTTIPLTPRQFRPHLATIREALAAQHVYWVDWNTDPDTCKTDICLDAAGRKLLWALATRQIMQPADGPPDHARAQP